MSTQRDRLREAAQPSFAFRAIHPQEKVDAIRRDRASGMKVLDVAAKHGVSGAYVSLLDNNRVRRVPATDAA